jgi:hypothetical protein
MRADGVYGVPCMYIYQLKDVRRSNYLPLLTLPMARCDCERRAEHRAGVVRRNKKKASTPSGRGPRGAGGGVARGREPGAEVRLALLQAPVVEVLRVAERVVV